MSRPQHSPQRDRAWGRFFAARGARPITRRCDAPTPAERYATWALQYRALPLEAFGFGVLQVRDANPPEFIPDEPTDYASLSGGY